MFVVSFAFISEMKLLGFKCTLNNVLFTEAYTDLLKYPLLGTKPVGSALGAGYTAVSADLPPCDPCNRFVHQAGKTFFSSKSLTAVS